MLTPWMAHRRATLCALTLMSSLGACDVMGIGGAPADVELVITNATEIPLIYLAVERESGLLIDPQPRLQVAEFQDHLVPPGSSHPLIVEGRYIDGDGLRLFIYEEVNEDAEFRATLDIPHEDLRLSDYQVHVRLINGAFSAAVQVRSDLFRRILPVASDEPKLAAGPPTSASVSVDRVDSREKRLLIFPRITPTK